MKRTLTIITLLFLAGGCTERNPAYNPGYGQPRSDGGIEETDSYLPQPDTFKSDLPKFVSAPVAAYDSPSAGKDGKPCTSPNGVLTKYVKGTPAKDEDFTDLDHRPGEIFGKIKVGNGKPPVAVSDCVEVDFGKAQLVKKIEVWMAHIDMGCNYGAGFACGKDPLNVSEGNQCGKPVFAQIFASADAQTWLFHTKIKVASSDELYSHSLDIGGQMVRYALVCRDGVTPYQPDLRVDYIEAVAPNPKY